jgi:flagellar biosynthesis/type III secretory pathway chaperone
VVEEACNDLVGDMVEVVEYWQVFLQKKMTMKDTNTSNKSFLRGNIAYVNLNI